MKNNIVFSLLIPLSLAACGSVPPPHQTTDIQSLVALLQKEEDILPQGLVDMAAASVLAETKSMPDLNSLAVTRINLQDPTGLYYGQIISLDKQAADIYTGKGISKTAHTVIVGGTSIRSGVTFIQRGGQLLDDLHTTLNALGEPPVALTTFDGGLIMIRDKNGHLWPAGKTKPLNTQQQEEYIKEFQKTASDILNNPGQIDKLKVAWGINSGMNTKSELFQQNLSQNIYGKYQDFIEAGEFDFAKFFSSREAVLKPQEVDITYTYPAEKYQLGGYEQQPFNWGRDGETYTYHNALYPFGHATVISDLIGCGPSATASFLFAYGANHGYLLNGKKYLNTRVDFNDFRRFAHQKVGNRGRLTGLMDGVWFRTGVMVWPQNLEKGLTQFTNDYVRRPDGSTPHWVGGFRMYSTSHNNNLLAALKVATSNGQYFPMIGGYWLENWSEGGHYSTVIFARSIERNNPKSNWHDIYIKTYDHRNSEYLVSGPWNPFGALYTLQ